MQYIERMLAAVLFSILFSALMSYILYVPEQLRVEGGIYFEYLTLFTLFTFLLTPFFIIGCLAAGIMIDKIVFKLNLPLYTGRLAGYAAAGTAANYFFFVSLFHHGLAALTLVFFLYGILASLLYMHIFLAVEKWKEKLNRNAENQEGSSDRRN